MKFNDQVQTKIIERRQSTDDDLDFDSEEEFDDDDDDEEEDGEQGEEEDKEKAEERSPLKEDIYGRTIDGQGNVLVTTSSSK